MNASSNIVNFKGDGGVTTKSPDPKDLNLATGAASPLDSLKTEINDFGKTILTKATIKALGTGIHYGKFLFVGNFRYSGTLLTFEGNVNDESNDIQVDVLGSGFDVIVNGITLRSFRCSFSGASYDSVANACIKYLDLIRQYNLSNIGELLINADCSILISTNAPLDITDSTTGIVDSTISHFYITVIKGQACEFTLRALFMASTEDPATDLTKVYGAASFSGDAYKNIGNASDRTIRDTSDSDFFFKGIDVGTNTEYDIFATTISIKGAALNSLKTITTKAFDSEYVSYNSDKDDVHVYASTIALTPYAPVVNGVKANYTHKCSIQIPLNQTLKDITGLKDSLFSVSFSTIHTDVMTLTLGQYQQNTVNTTPTPTELDLFNFRNSTAYVSVVWKNSKKQTQLQFYRDYNGSNDVNIRFYILSKDLTVQEIGNLTSDDIESIDVVFLKPVSSIAPVTFKGLKRSGLRCFQFSMTKSSTAGTPPRISNFIDLGGNGTGLSMIPSLLRIEPSLDYNTATFVELVLEFKGLYTDSIIKIREIPSENIINRKLAIFGKVGEANQTPLFIAKGGIDEQKMIVQNVSSTFVIELQQFNLTNSQGADATFACIFNQDITTALVLNGDLDTTPNDRICEFIDNASLPIPARSFPSILAFYQELDLNNEVTTSEYANGLNSQAAEGWNPLSVRDFFTSVIGANRTNINTFIFFTDNGDQLVYRTTTPVTPEADPTGNFTISAFDDVNNQYTITYTAQNAEKGYFNTHTLEFMVISRDSSSIIAFMDFGSIDINTNKVNVRLTRTDGAPFDISQITGFGFVSINKNYTPISNNSLWSLGTAVVNLEITADQVNAPAIQQTTESTVIGININYDPTFTPVLYKNNLVTDSEAKYKIRFVLTGVNLSENAYLLLTPGDTFDQTNPTVQVSYKKWVQTKASNDFNDYIETSTITPQNTYIYALVPNDSTIVQFVLIKFKLQSQLLPSDPEASSRIRYSQLISRCDGLPTLNIGDGGLFVSNITGNISNVTTIIPTKVYSINEATVAGINRLVSSDIFVNDDNIGYKMFNDTIYRNNRLDGSTPQVNFLDTGMTLLLVNPREIDVSVVSGSFINALGKKASSNISGAGNKIINILINPTSIVTRPVFSPQLILKPISTLGTRSQLLNSAFNLFDYTNNDYNMDISVDDADASNVVGGYLVQSVIASDLDFASRPVILSKTGKTKYPIDEISFTPSVDGVANPTFSITRITPAVADFPYQLSLTTVEGCLQQQLDGTQSITTDLTTSPTKFIVIRVTVTSQTNWDVPGLRFGLLQNPNNSNTQVIAGIYFGTMNAQALNFPVFPDKTEFVVSIKNVQQTIRIQWFAFVENGGFFVNPDDNSNIISQIPCIAGTNGITKQLFGWIVAGSGNIEYSCEFGSMTYISKENSIVVNNTTGTILEGGHYLAPIVRKETEIQTIRGYSYEDDKYSETIDEFSFTEDVTYIDTPILYKGSYKITKRIQYSLEECENTLKFIKDQITKLIYLKKRLDIVRQNTISIVARSKDIEKEFISFKNNINEKRKDVESILSEYKNLQTKLLDICSEMKQFNLTEYKKAYLIPAHYKYSVSEHLSTYYLQNFANRNKINLPIVCKFKNEDLKYSLKINAYFGKYCEYSDEYKKSLQRYVDPFIKNYENFKVTKESREITPEIESLKGMLLYISYYYARHNGLRVEHQSTYENLGDEQIFAMPKYRSRELEYALYIIADNILKDENNWLTKYVKNKDNIYRNESLFYCILLDVAVLLQNGTFEEINILFSDIFGKFVDIFIDRKILINKIKNKYPLSLTEEKIIETDQEQLPLLLDGHRISKFKNLDQLTVEKIPVRNKFIDFFNSLFKDIHLVKLNNKKFNSMLDEIIDLAKEIENDY